MISSRQQFALSYFERCLAADGYIVMKSHVPFRIGEQFGGAMSGVLGNVNSHMVVAAQSSAEEAKAQLKKVSNIDIRPIDMRAKYYYRIVPSQKHNGWNPYFSHPVN